MIKQLVIWDYDNTLADTIDCLTLAFQDVYRAYHLPPITREWVAKMVAGYKDPIWDRFTEQERNQAAVLYHERCLAYSPQNVFLFEDALKWLEYLKMKKIPQVIVSNKMTSEIETECNRLGITPYFERIVGVVPRWQKQQIRYKKPEPEFVAPLLQEMKPDKVLVIGDGITDIALAQNIGADIIWVSEQKQDGIFSCSHAQLLDVLKRRFD